VYGNAIVPIAESTPTGVSIANPYGRTKYMNEEIIKVYNLILYTLLLVY